MSNPVTGNRIRMVTQDGGTRQEVQRREPVKGYEFKKDHYLTVTDEDLESVRVESSAVMTVEKLLDGGSHRSDEYDAGYFLAPGGDEGEERRCRPPGSDRQDRQGRAPPLGDQSARAHCGRCARWVVPAAWRNTFYEQSDLNSPKELFDGAEDVQVDFEMVALATQLVEGLVSP